MREIQILSLQARLLVLAGWAWLLIGIACGYDPLTVSFRALIAAVVTMIIAGWLLRIGADALPADEMPASDNEKQEADGTGNG